MATSEGKFELTMELESEYMIDGFAEDGEAVIRLRPAMETYVREDEKIDYDFTKLFWNLDEEGKMVFELHFFKGLSEPADKELPPAEPVS